MRGQGSGDFMENTPLRMHHSKFGESRCSRSSSTKRYSSSHRRDRIASRYSRCRPKAAARPPLPTGRACRHSPRSAFRICFSFSVNRHGATGRRPDFEDFSVCQCSLFSRMSGWLIIPLIHTIFHATDAISSLPLMNISLP